MYAKKSPFRAWPLVMVLLLIIGALIGSTAAKYISTQKVKATVTFTARLAEDVLLQEHKVVRQTDGSYILSDDLLPEEDANGNVINNENKYILLPGLDVPKDPFMTVVNKTPIRSYLYIEVVDKTNSSIEYQIDTTKWSELTGVAGNYGGTVYVYYQLVDGNPNYVLTHENCPKGQIPILIKPDGTKPEIKVSQKLLTADKELTGESLTFYAYLFESYAKEGFTENTVDHIKEMYTYHINNTLK